MSRGVQDVDPETILSVIQAFTDLPLCDVKDEFGWMTSKYPFCADSSDRMKKEEWIDFRKRIVDILEQTRDELPSRINEMRERDEWTHKKMWADLQKWKQRLSQIKDLEFYRLCEKDKCIVFFHEERAKYKMIELIASIITVICDNGCKYSIGLKAKMGRTVS